MDVSQFDFHLPEELIAQSPSPRRSDSRLMVLLRETGKLEHRRFSDLTVYLRPGDVLVVNDTRVRPARLIGMKKGTGGRVEILLLKPLGEDRWETLVKPARRLKPGTTILFGNGELSAVVEGESDVAGGRIVRLFYEAADLEALLNRLGEMPLPPYIRERLEDPERYQTVYARAVGSAAAPTAGLHFTPELLEEVRKKGVDIAAITLHVGLGTFRPVTVERVEEHRMHAEYYEVGEEAALRQPEICGELPDREARQAGCAGPGKGSLEDLLARELAFAARALRLGQLCRFHASKNRTTVRAFQQAEKSQGNSNAYWKRAGARALTGDRLLG